MQSENIRLGYQSEQAAYGFSPDESFTAEHGDLGNFVPFSCSPRDQHHINETGERVNFARGSGYYPVIIQQIVSQIFGETPVTEDA
jgi:hypothetical protein